MTKEEKPLVKLTTKERFLEVLQFFFTETNEKTGKTLQDVVDHFYWNLNAEVKKETIRSDIEALKSSEEFPVHEMDGYEEGMEKRYYYAGRLLNVQQLRVLIDAVMTSPVIPKDERLILMKEIRRWTTKDEGELLKNNVWVPERPTKGHATFSEDVAKIHTAIIQRHPIQFYYGSYEFDSLGQVVFLLRERTSVPEPRVYEMEPYELYWHSGRYYVTGMQRDGKFRHYRLDRMVDLSVCKDQTFYRNEHYEKKIRTVLERTFNMYSGVVMTVELKVDQRLLNVFVDKFGTEEPIYKYDKEEGVFYFKHRVLSSDGLLIWLLGLGSQVEAIHPPSLVDAMQKEIKKMHTLYE